MAANIRSFQAIAMFSHTLRNDIVIISDGTDKWLCRVGPWCAALQTMDPKAPVAGPTGGDQAYTELRGAVVAPVASQQGNSKPPIDTLVSDALTASAITAADAAKYPKDVAVPI